MTSMNSLRPREKKGIFILGSMGLVVGPSFLSPLALSHL